MGARMHTQLAVYGYDSPIATHWLAQLEDGTPTAAILRFDGWVTIIATPTVDIPELATFLQVVGEFGYIESTPFVCRQLSPFFPGEYTSSHTMTYLGEPVLQLEPHICTNPPLRQVYDLICAGSSFMANTTHWDSWYPHVSHLVRHELGTAVMLYQEDMPVVTGGIYTTSDSHGVIGSLTTLGAYRGKGYAAQITRSLIHWCQSRGLTPALYIAQDSLAEYYGKLGFSPTGQWAEIKLSQL